MSLRVVLRRAAQEEFESAATWYEEQRRGLGEEFVREIDDAIVKAADHLERYPLVFGDVRRAVLRRFPYAVYFRRPHGQQEHEANLPTPPMAAARRIAP